MNRIKSAPLKHLIGELLILNGDLHGECEKLMTDINTDTPENKHDRIVRMQMIVYIQVLLAEIIYKHVKNTDMPLAHIKEIQKELSAFIEWAHKEKIVIKRPIQEQDV